MYSTFAFTYEFCLLNFTVYYMTDYDCENNLFYTTILSIPFCFAFTSVI